MNGNTAGFKGNTKENSLVTKVTLNGCFLQNLCPLHFTHKKSYWLCYHWNCVSLFKSLWVTAWSQQNCSIPPCTVAHTTYLSLCGCPLQTVRALTCLQASQYWGCLFYCHSLSTPLLTTSCFIHAITWFKMLILTALWRTMTQRHPNTFTHTVYVAYWWRIEEKRMKV